MKRSSNNPARSTATGTQKCRSLSALISLDVAFGISVCSDNRFLGTLGMTIPIFHTAPLLIAFAFGVRGGLFALVGFPSLIDHIGVNGVGVRDGHVRVGKGKLGWIGEAGHAL